MHDTYTILHLTPWARVGLVCLSAVFALVMFGIGHLLQSGISRKLARAIAWLAHAAAAITLFWLFLWLSPQVYYLFYWAIFDDLPWQTVIAAPPSPGALLRLFAIDFTADLPPIAQGLLGWGLLVQALWHSQVARKR